MSDLAELQRWFAEALVERELDYSCLSERVADDDRLTGEQRIFIYAQGYQLRLLECMRAEFECLAAVMGQPLFDQFALMYLAQRPSRSWTLFNLGEGFAGFLRSGRPLNDDVSLKLPEQLAELEHRVACAIRAAGSERKVVPVVDPLMVLMGEDVPLALADTASVMESDFNLAALFDNEVKPQTGSKIPVGDTCLLVSRRQYRVSVAKLETWQYRFLSDPALQNGGGDLLVSWRDRVSEIDLLRLASWLARLCEAGVFVTPDRS